MNVALELVLLAQQARDLYESLHRVIRGPNDPGAEKQSLDVITPIERQRQRDDLGHGEARPWHVPRAPVHAVEAVIDAEISEENLQQRDAAAIGREAVADPHPRRGPDAPSGRRVAFRGPTASARGVVF